VTSQLLKHAGNVFYQPANRIPGRQSPERLTSFQAFIFLSLATIDRAEKVRCPSWLVSERQKGDSSEVEHGHGPTHAKGDYGKGTKRSVSIFFRTNARVVIIAHVR